MKIDCLRLLLLAPSVLVLHACAPLVEVQVEGDEAGECDDGVDNDQDGPVDCDDSGCATAVACVGDDDDAVDDDDAADDDETASDDDVANDDDSADDDDTAHDDDDSMPDDDDDSVLDDDDAASDDDDTAPDDDDTAPDDDDATPSDADGDGYAWDLDCDDTDAGINPGAPEVCDGVDQDCDGNIDDGFDADADGFTSCAGDCADLDASVNPAAVEACNGQDDDCADGIPVDESDADGDGSPPCAGDCADTDATRYPGALELCDLIDTDCDGLPGADEVDGDADGFAECEGDCDPSDPATSPIAPETCDGQDNNCDGAVDEGLDIDGDGWTPCGGDCDDADVANFPGNLEVCDGQDNDCDPSSWAVGGEADADFDGSLACEDCDEADALVNPTAVEVCDNGVDDDCDGTTPDVFDGDGDGDACTVDCDDQDSAVSSGAVEEFDNGVDDNCDGMPATAPRLVWESGLLSTTDNLGRSLAVGDLNADGFDDLIAAAYETVLVWYGSPSGLEATAGWVAPSPIGQNVSSGGDINGDGFDDLLVGDQSAWYPDGRAWVFLGSASGLEAASHWDETSQTPGERFGESVAFLGDLNGDGYDEIGVGAPYFEDAASPYTNVGRLYVFEGSAIGLPFWTTPYTITEGTIDNGYFGSTIATAGDVTGDGIPDVAVGAPSAYAGGGRVWVFDGLPAFLSAYARDFFTDGFYSGMALAPAGDVDGDGYGDLLVGAPHAEMPLYREGSINLHLGGPYGVGSPPAWTALGGAVNAQMGFGVAGNLDLNGDSYPDLVVGARGYHTAPLAEGEAHVFLGAPGGPQAIAALVLDSADPDSFFGAAVAAGDFDGDGLGDFAVGAPRFDGASPHEGRVFVYSAGTGWTGEGDDDDSAGDDNDSGP